MTPVSCSLWCELNGVGSAHGDLVVSEYCTCTACRPPPLHHYMYVLGPEVVATASSPSFKPDETRRGHADSQKHGDILSQSVIIKAPVSEPAMRPKPCLSYLSLPHRTAACRLCRSNVYVGVWVSRGML